MNPASGSEDHVDAVLELATDRGFSVRVTEAAGDARRYAAAEADGADLLAAVGGVGTIPTRTRDDDGDGRNRADDRR
ncbi:hypothetical protein [Halovivax sp.]|uniref:hypothetical protein n=1 Tax=Halovivax sp. TaxID=1935978 RepID=UPI0025C6799E|nr:hypothetical protein [Halovivax sp.]